MLNWFYDKKSYFITWQYIGKVKMEIIVNKERSWQKREFKLSVMSSRVKRSNWLMGRKVRLLMLSNWPWIEMTPKL